MKNLLTLSTLGSIPLSRTSTAILATAEHRAAGDPVWLRRKIIEFKLLLALCQAAPYRIKLLFTDMAAEPLRVVIALHCPIPLRPEGGGRLRRSEEDTAVLGITYPREVMLRPLPGTHFVEILNPDEVWHPNVASSKPQGMCLGATLPRGIPLTEILVLAYASLSLQVVTVDRFDSAGVLNGDAARWFEARPDAIPLTKEPFLRGAAKSAGDAHVFSNAEANGGIA